MGVLSFLGWHIWFFKRLNGVLWYDHYDTKTNQ
jgi:hypothetical protein